MTIAFTASTVYIDEAADALQTGNVFVSSDARGVGDTDTLASSLQQQIGDDSIGVAVLSPNALLGATPVDITDIVETLLEQTSYDTIVVVVGDDVAAGSPVLAPNEALRIANEAEGSTDSPTAALTETIQGIQAAQPAPAPGSSGGLDGGAILGIVLAIAALGAVVGVLVGVARARRARARADRGLPDGVSNHLAALAAVGSEYAAVGASGNQTAAQTAQDIEVLVGNVSELFRRLDARTDDGQRQLAAVEYDDKLRKLSGALQRDYLLDILTHPNLWDDPAERQREVEGALTAVSQELVENIKQVNARRALHFQVSLDGLMGRRKELQDWDRAFDTATGDGPPPPP